MAGGHSACVKALLSEAAPSQADRVIVNHVDPNKQVLACEVFCILL